VKISGASPRNSALGFLKGSGVAPLQTLSHSHSALGAFFRRQKAQLGAPKAITATAHKQ